MLALLPNLPLERAHKVDRVVDFALLWVASAIAAWPEGAARVVALGVTTTALWYLGSRVLRQYHPANGRGFLGDLALTVVLLLGILVPLWLGDSELERPEGVRTFAAIVVPSMLFVRAGILGLHRRERPAETVLLVGSGPFARLTEKEIVNGGRRVLGHLRFDDETPDPHLHAPVLGATAELERIFKDEVVDEVYMTPDPSEHAPDVQRAIATCERFGVPFAIPLCSYRLTRAKPACHFDEDDGFAHYLSVQRKPVQQWLKRLFDIGASGAALVALSPLLVSTALAVKFTSRGPVLFRQQRVGLHGRTFDMLKFRSMVNDAEAQKARLLAQNEQSGPVFKIQRDPRVTAVGRFIRRFSIDELPQLVNVLRGDMSIVGPRPPLPSEVRKYEAWQRRRLSVRPGLTCVWQVSGRNSIGFREWMFLDMRYIDHWSLQKDFQLILQTVPVVLTGKGAS